MPVWSSRRKERQVAAEPPRLPETRTGRTRMNPIPAFWRHGRPGLGVDADKCQSRTEAGNQAFRMQTSSACGTRTRLCMASGFVSEEAGPQQNLSSALPEGSTRRWSGGRPHLPPVSDPSWRSRGKAGCEELQPLSRRPACSAFLWRPSGPSAAAGCLRRGKRTPSAADGRTTAKR